MRRLVILDLQGSGQQHPVDFNVLIGVGIDLDGKVRRAVWVSQRCFLHTDIMNYNCGSLSMGEGATWRNA